MKQDIALNIIEETRMARDAFSTMVGAFSSDLWSYCTYIAGSPWDGEDLYQETLLKAFGMLPERWSDLTDQKSYLFRMATNAWFDLCRKRKHEVGRLPEDDISGVPPMDTLELEEALLKVHESLTPKQAAAFLLVDVFRFSAEEAAAIVHTTRGGIYAALQRARQNLKENHSGEVKPLKSRDNETNKTVDMYLEAFNTGNLDKLLGLFSSTAHNEAFLGFQEYSKAEMKKGSMRFGLPGHTAKRITLWGRPVIMVITDDGELHDIQVQEVENDQIVVHESYFFRKEFMLAAGKELGFTVQLNKPPVDWRS
ncbi:RNA polymerase sigma factor [Rossellomorea marisflavi]|uniref:RNA polymerase sigma factor n=1 Tax=Rossellomorea marisflavi TaxID=189381 RepID=UPI0035173014